jgi:hypothetical protein
VIVAAGGELDRQNSDANCRASARRISSAGWPQNSLILNAVLAYPGIARTSGVGRFARVEFEIDHVCPGVESLRQALELQ